MAFKPIVIEKEIKGTVYKAQFNGVSTMYRANDETEGKAMKLAQFLFENVLVEPKINDVDEYFGTDVDLMSEVTEFAAEVMRADEKYFPDPSNGSGTKAKSK